jgi:hypothetical protein
MNHHNLATCISLAESLPRERETYRILDELSQDLSRQLAAAETAWNVAVVSAASGHGDWGHARQAGEVVKQLRSAVQNEVAL